MRINPRIKYALRCVVGYGLMLWAMSFLLVLLGAAIAVFGAHMEVESGKEWMQTAFFLSLIFWGGFLGFRIPLIADRWVQQGRK